LRNTKTKDRMPLSVGIQQVFLKKYNMYQNVLTSNGEKLFSI